MCVLTVRACAPCRLHEGKAELLSHNNYLLDGWTNHSDCKTTILMMVGTRRQQMYVGSATVKKAHK